MIPPRDDRNHFQPDFDGPAKDAARRTGMTIGCAVTLFITVLSCAAGAQTIRFAPAWALHHIPTFAIPLVLLAVPWMIFCAGRAVRGDGSLLTGSAITLALLVGLYALLEELCGGPRIR